MPDWVAYVRERLRLAKCTPEREATIIEELAQQLNDAYLDGLQRGLSEQEALAAAKLHVNDWTALANDLAQAGIGGSGGTRHQLETNVGPRAEKAGIVSNSSNQKTILSREAFATRTARTLEDLVQDLHYATRVFAKRLLFTFVAILTLALGIGANTAIFSVVNAVLLQPLPYPDSNRLAVVWSSFGKEGHAPSSGPVLVALREHSRLFDQFAGIWVQDGALTGKGEPEQVKLGWVTSNFLSLLSARPYLGRYFQPEEQGEGAASAVVLTYELWQRRYGADSGIIGQTVALSDRTCTVVGVLPAGFKLIFPEGASVPAKVDVYAPFLWNPADQPRDRGYIRIISRVRPGVSIPRAQAELDNIAAQLRSEFLEYSEQDLRLQALSLQGDAARNARTALSALFAGSGLVLLITCANVAMLILARGRERKNEVALRAALGAQPARIVRQLLTESLFLSCLGGIVALGVSWGILQLLWILQPAGVARMTPAGLDVRVLGFNFAISMLCGILCGLSPALESRKANLESGVRDDSRSSSADKGWFQQWLIGGEVALTFVLLTSSALLTRTFIDVLRVNPGFDSTNVLTFQVSLPGVRYRSVAAAYQLLREAQRRLSTLPTVQSVGVVSHLPFDDGLPNWYSYFWRDGAPREEQNSLMADHRSVLPSFFDSLGITFVAGRNFDTSDEVANRKVVIVDDSLARQLWPHGDAVGKLLNVENGQFVRDVAEVVGVVKHVQYHSLTNQVRPQLYLPYTLAPRANMSFTVRAQSPSQSLVPSIRQEISNLDKDLPVAHVRPMDAYVADARMGTRFISVLSGSMGAIALLLACVGIYGVTSSSVMRRTKEIGIRMALGARRGNIALMVLRAGMLPVVMGGLLGLALSFGLMPLLSSLLYGVRPLEPLLLGSVMAFLCLIWLVAASLPIQRVVRGNPVAALRCE